MELITTGNILDTGFIAIMSPTKGVLCLNGHKFNVQDGTGIFGREGGAERL